MTTTGCGRSRTALVAGILLRVSSAECLYAQAVGIVIYRDNSALPESASKVFEYKTMRNMGTVTNYLLPNGKKVELTKFQPQQPVEYPDLLSRSITDPGQIGPLERESAASRETVKRYPNAAPFLNPHIQVFNEMIRRAKGGEILLNGAWMSRSDYDAIILREKNDVKERFAKSNENKRVRDEQARRLDMETRRHKR